VIGVCNGGPFHGHGFAIPDGEAERMKEGPLRYQLVTIAITGPVQERHVHTRQGFHPELEGAAVVYILDLEMTRMHGFLVANTGRKVRCCVYSPEPRWTARLRRP
jgi:hypothetical protein